MKIMKDFIPLNDSDASVAITASSERSGFTTSNLKNIQPVKSWKTNDIVTDSWIKLYFGAVAVTYDSLFLNRINFADCVVKYSLDDVTYTTVETITGLVKDEVAEEEYMHRFVDLSGLSYKYIKIEIPTQTPLFDFTYFKIGNVLVGDMIEIWNPKQGFSIIQLPKIAINEYRSGFIEVEKLGRTRRAFNGTFDKITKTEYDKIVKTYSPIVLYLDLFEDKERVYLVRNITQYKTDYDMVNMISMNFGFEEIV